MRKRSLFWVVLACVLVGGVIHHFAFSGEDHGDTPPKPVALVPVPPPARPGSALDPQAVQAYDEETGDLGRREQRLAGLATDHEPTIAGRDDDHDGVRDDIERYIDSTYADPSVRAAMLNYAAVQQKALLQNTNPNDAQAAMGQVLRSLDCINAVGGPSDLEQSKNVLALMLNTPLRQQAYAQAMNRGAGFVYMASSNPCGS